MPPIESDIGKEVLAYAMNQDYAVIEFQERADGQMIVTDITEHVEQLEKMALDDTTD